MQSQTVKSKSEHNLIQAQPERQESSDSLSSGNESTTKTSSNSNTEKYFIDTDCGIDDAECIFTMLGHLDVIGISTVAGNCSEEQSALNAAKVLQLCNKEVPIYKGCKAAILEKHIDLGPVHGKDGLGDTEIAQTIKGYTHCIKDEHAVNAIIRTAKENPGLNIICIAPLTNLGMALRLEPELANLIGSLTVLGGSYKGQGNITLQTEYNFRQDPEAANIVFTSGIKNTTLIPWETCVKLEHQPKTKEHIERLYDQSTPLGVLHKQSTDFHASFEGSHYLVDSLCGIISVDKEVVMKDFSAHGVIETAPGMSKGSIQFFSNRSMTYMVDEMNKRCGIDVSKPNMRVVTHINLERAIDVVAKAKKNLESKKDRQTQFNGSS